MSASREMTKEEKLWRGTLDMVSTVSTLLWYRADEKNKHLFKDDIKEYCDIISVRCKAISESVEESK